jgi:hypothetical protein
MGPPGPPGADSTVPGPAGPAGPPGPGVDNYLDLVDTLPNSYVGIKGGFPVVSQDEAGLVNTAPVITYDGEAFLRFVPTTRSNSGIRMDAGPQYSTAEVVLNNDKNGEAFLTLLGCRGVFGAPNTFAGRVGLSAFYGNTQIQASSLAAQGEPGYHVFSATSLDDSSGTRVGSAYIDVGMNDVDVNIVGGFRAEVVNAGLLDLTIQNLPTVDPLKAHKVWNDAGTLKLSGATSTADLLARIDKLAAEVEALKARLA